MRVMRPNVFNFSFLVLDNHNNQQLDNQNWSLVFDSFGYGTTICPTYVIFGLDKFDVTVKQELNRLSN